MIRLIRALYEGFRCAVIHDEKFFAYFAVESGVKQGCILTGLLFLLIVNWMMKKTTENRVTGIGWVGDKPLHRLC
jgi:hypothetical protein